MSLAVFEQLGARRHVERARRLLRELGVSPPSARRTRPAKGLLTGREIEVARLVAQGLSASEIAERLVFCPLTVNSHLHHIYNRLGIGSRSALSRYMMEAGLLSSQHENA